MFLRDDYLLSYYCLLFDDVLGCVSQSFSFPDDILDIVYQLQDKLVSYYVNTPFRFRYDYDDLSSISSDCISHNIDLNKDMKHYYEPY